MSKGVVWLQNEMQRNIVFLVVSAIALIVSFFMPLKRAFDPAWIAIILCGVPIVKGAIAGLRCNFDIKADLLVSLALVGAILIGESFAAGEVAVIMQLGAMLEELTVAKARAGIERLVALSPQTAHRLNEGEVQQIAVDQVTRGDSLRVFPGEAVPVDGTIIKGTTSINQAIMTGESMPVDKTVGDQVLSGTINQFGIFEMRADQVGDDSSLNRMIRLVQNADASKAKIVRLTDRFATVIVVVALLTALFTWWLTGEAIRAVTILVVFCPCALVLATPTAIMAAIGNATKHGFLVREGDALERLSMVQQICFDKTGTLTYGTPVVVRYESLVPTYSDQDIFRLAASAELFSEHPLGKAVVASYQLLQSIPQLGTALVEPEAFTMLPGLGITAIVEGQQILAGNQKLLTEYQIMITKEYEKEHQTVIYLAINQQLVGILGLSDQVREAAVSMITEIKSLNLKPVLLTGDHHAAAHSIASQVGIQTVFADCLPADKLGQIHERELAGERVCMIGDGVNDAPSLKRAFVGIAMGKIGSDIAVDAADIVLVNDNLSKLPHLFALSQKMMVTMKRNIAFSMILNMVAIMLAVSGKLSPITGALVHNAGSVLVIIQSSLLLTWSDQKKDRNIKRGSDQRNK